MLSFWEKESFLNYDNIILGGGIVGLSTAISLKELNPTERVLVLERGTFPSGASTKNAGFACFGSLTEILTDLETMPEDEVLQLVKWRWEGLQLLRKRLGDENLNYQNYGGYEILRDKEISALEQLDRVNDLLYPLFGKRVYEEDNGAVKTLGFNTSEVKGLIFNSLEGQIHTGFMMKSLQRLASEKGVEVITGTEVSHIEDGASSVEVVTNSGIRFRSSRVAVCTNAFSKRFLPELNVYPGRGVVLVTKPIPGLKFKGTFHYDEGYYYFRNYEDRVIFGGGRNLDIQGENTDSFGVRDLITDKLKSDLASFIIPNTPYEVDLTWSGIMAFGTDKRPILKKYSDRVFVGARLGGMGVAIGSKMGLDLASLMLQ